MGYPSEAKMFKGEAEAGAAPSAPELKLVKGGKGSAEPLSLEGGGSVKIRKGRARSADLLALVQPDVSAEEVRASEGVPEGAENKPAVTRIEREKNWLEERERLRGRRPVESRQSGGDSNRRGPRKRR